MSHSDSRDAKGDDRLEFSLFDGQFQFSLSPRILKLRTAFGTSHSSTMTRKNALIRVRILQQQQQPQVILEGYGEIGLPPKKPGVYEANYEDVVQFYRLFSQYAQSHAPSSSSSISSDRYLVVDPQYDPFFELPDIYFAKLRFEENVTNSELFSPRDRVVRRVFSLLDGFSSIHAVPEGRPAKSGLETALLDVWGKQLQLPLHQMLMGRQEQKEGSWHSFYTVGLNPDISEMKRSLIFGLQHTPLIKIKMNDDLEFGEAFLLPSSFFLLPSSFFLLPSSFFLLPSSFFLLPLTFLLPFSKQSVQRIGRYYSATFWRGFKCFMEGWLFSSSPQSSSLSHQYIIYLSHPSYPLFPITLSFYQWTVDANAAWSSETSFKFIEVLRPFASRVYAIEQPFPFDLIKGDRKHSK
jgi:hypothetical protein